MKFIYSIEQFSTKDDLYMKRICLISPEIGKDKGGIQNWMYYVKKLLNYNNYDIDYYSYKDSKTFKLVKVYNSNVLILATFKMAIFILPILLLTKKKVFIFVHGNEILKLNIFLKGILIFLTKRKNTYFIANSQSISKLFFDITKRKVDFVQYPFMEIKNNHYKRAKENNFFTLTRLVKRKNIKNIIKAFSVLKENNFKFNYVIAGTGPEFEILTKTVNKLGLSNEIKFVGKVTEEEKNHYYSKSNYFLLPSIFDEKEGSIEGYGIVFIEANAYGIPVLSGNTGGMVEAVEDGKTGLHSNGEANDIVIKIKQLTELNFDIDYIKNHAQKHNYLKQEKFLTFIKNKLNE